MKSLDEQQDRRGDGEARWWRSSAEMGVGSPGTGELPALGSPASDAPQAVVDAQAVIDRTLAHMDSSETRPLLDEPPTPFRLRRFGDSDLYVFPVMLGGNPFGWTADPDTSEAVLDSYLEAGGNFLDLADSSAGGRSEIIVGRWMRSRGVRERMVLTTKVGRAPGFEGLGAAAVTGAVEASLERLGTDWLDVLFFHDDDPSVPLEESLAAAHTLQREGRIRYLAVSNFGPERLMEARILAGQMGLPRFIALQTHYNLVHREEYERRLADVVRAQHLAVVPYFALANGFLTGKYRNRESLRTPADGTSEVRAQRAAKYVTKRGLRTLDALTAVAAEHDVPVSTAALAWLLTKPYVAAPVTSASRPEQVADIVRAAQVHLTRHQVATLDRVSG